MIKSLDYAIYIFSCNSLFRNVVFNLHLFVGLATNVMIILNEFLVETDENILL